MEDPTGGLWIYLIFLIIPLARILPRILRKYRRKNAGSESDEQHSQEGFFANDLLPKRPRFQSLRRKMVGWEKTTLSDKIN